jgi:hypothetical protein
VTRAWCPGHREQAVIFTLRIASALFIAWDLEHGLVTTHR